MAESKPMTIHQALAETSKDVAGINELTKRLQQLKADVDDGNINDVVRQDAVSVANGLESMGKAIAKQWQDELDQALRSLRVASEQFITVINQQRRPREISRRPTPPAN